MTAPAIEPIDVMRRREFVRLSAGSLATLAAGCRPPRDRALARGNSVIVAVPAAGNLNPTPWLDGELWLAFLPLVVMNDQWKWEGRLAERWEHSRDYREWTYHLRRGVRWHDGVPVTAHDVKFSFDLWSDPDILEFTPGAIESEVLDDYTVRMRQRYHENYQWFYIPYPKHLLEHLDPKAFYDWDFWNRPVGDGPYRFVRGVPQTTMEFEANPDYYRGRPRIERVVLKFTGRSGLADLLAGEVDAITQVNPAWIPTLANDKRFRVYYSSYQAHYQVIAWQHRDPLFQDARVRRALTLAIDRHALLQLLHFPDNAPLTDGPVTDSQFRSGDLGEPLPHDPAGARALLEDAGWHAGTTDGIRERNGTPFRFTALISGAAQQLAVFVQAEFRRVGVDMALQLVPNVKGRIVSGRFQAAIYEFHQGVPTRLGSGDSGAGGMGYEAAKVTELYNRAERTADPAVEDRCYAEMRAIFRVDVPATYLVPSMNASVAHRRIRGLHAPTCTDVLRCTDGLTIDNRSAP